MKKSSKIFDFEDFKQVINQKGIAIEPQYHEFYEIPRGVSSAKFAEKKPKLKEIQVVQFIKGPKKIFWKNDFQSDYDSAVFLQRKILQLIDNNEYFERYPEGVNQEKMDDILLKLCPFMDANRRKFWINLKTKPDVEDLAVENEER